MTASILPEMHDAGVDRIFQAVARHVVSGTLMIESSVGRRVGP